MMMATISSSAVSGLRCSFSRKRIGNSTSITMNAKSENKGRAVIRDHFLMPEGGLRRYLLITRCKSIESPANALLSQAMSAVAPHSR